MIHPYACMPDTRAAIDFYVAAFGAEVTVEPLVMDDGRIGHAEILIGDARMMMSDPYPELHVVPPSPAGSPVTLYLKIADVDATASRAVAAGAVLDRGPEDSDHGRMAVIRDPAGHRWMLHDA